MPAAISSITNRRNRSLPDHVLVRMPCGMSQQRRDNQQPTEQRCIADDGQDQDQTAPDDHGKLRTTCPPVNARRYIAVYAIDTVPVFRSPESLR